MDGARPVDKAMLDALWTFLTATHDPRNVLAAAAVCGLSATAGFSALRFAEGVRRGWFWVAIAAAVFGAGAWTTHFVAIVGFRPDLALGFSHASLAWSAMAAVVAGAALAGAARARHAPGRIGLGLGAGGAIALMHHVGVAGISGCVATTAFAPAAAAADLGAALVAASAVAFRASRQSIAPAAALLTLGVAALHFVWMGGVTLVAQPGALSGLTRADIAPLTLLAALTLAMVMIGVTLAQARAAREVRRLAAVAAGMGDGVLLMDAQGRADWVNPAFTALTGLSLADLAQRQPLAALADGPADAVAAGALAHALAAGERTARELRLRAAAGGVGPWVNATATPLPGGDGAMVTLHDLTAIRARAAAAEAARAEAEQTRARLLAALEAAPIGMAMFDADLRLVACNEAYRTLMPGHDAALQPGAAFTPQAGAAEHALLSAPGGAEDEIRLADGRWIWRRSAPGPGGEIMAARLDVTERRMRESELEQARDRAQLASRAKSEFISVMSHELRTPLNGVLGFAGILSASPLSADQRGHVARIMESGGLLLSILNDILDLAALDNDRLALEETRIDLDRLLDGLRADHEPVALAKGLAFAVERDADAPAAVAGDAARVAQALRSLLSNAVKFTEGGRVSLRARAGRRGEGLAEVIYEVADTGVGVAPEAVRRLFDAFAQADGSATRRFGGVGLGLTLTHKLVTLMKGEITVESRPGAGSTFRIRIPHRPAAAAAARPLLRFGARGLSAGD